MENWKVLSEADDSFHIQHANGKSFTVEKKKLTPRAHEFIKKMCSGGEVQKFEDGGSVQPEVPAALAPNPAQEPAGGATVDWAPAAPAAVSAQPAAVPAPQNPLAQNAIDQNAILDKELVAANGLQNNVDQSSGAVAKASNELTDNLNKIQTPEQIAEQYKAKESELMQNVMDKKIDPDRYFHNQSTGSRVLSGIALALAGVGSGAEGQAPALAMINGAIKRDMEAQQADQSQTMNLWKMNHENMKDAQQASLATQNQLISGVQAKIALIGAGTNNQNSRFQAAKMVGELEKEKAANRMRLGLYSQAAQGGANSSGVDPVQLVPSMVPPEHQKQAITEIGQAKNAVENEDSIKKLFYQAAKDTRPSTGRSATSVMNSVPGYAPPSIKALNLLYDPLIHDNEGRINELEQQHVQANSPQWGDSDETVDKKWNAVKTFLEHKKSAPTAKAYGIDINSFPQTSSREAPEIQTMGGVQYQKVNGGWQKVK